jgi:general secretion pathway protein E
MTDHRTLREKLAPDFLRELDQHEAKLGPHAGPDFGPRLAHALVQDAARARASDVHLEPGSDAVTIRFRVDGVLSDVTSITSSEARILTNQLKTLASLDPVMSFVPRDAHASCAVESGQLNLRLALTPSQTGEALTIRLMDPKQLQRSIDDLGLAAGDLVRLESWIEEGAGMFLAAGPTGCGKTTTVYSLLHEVKKSDRAVVSLEDPVEYQIDGIVQVQLDERHHLNFGEGIKQMLRMDPDYLMLGEIRDPVSAHAAVDAALSGRALLSTLHCRDAVGAVSALRNWGLLDHEIAEALSVVIGQRLVRRLCPHCKRTRELTEKEHRWFSSAALPAPKQVTDAPGCDRCGQLGYLGRMGIFELWRLNEQDYKAILEHSDEHALRRALAEREHRPILADGLAKVLAGITSVSELRRAASAGFPV